MSDIYPPTCEIQQSKSDPESGQLHKESKPDGFHNQRTPNRGQQAQHCGECTDHSGQCQRRRTRSRDTEGYRKAAGEVAEVHGTGCGIPQRAGVPPACASWDIAGGRLPEACEQGRLGNTVLPMAQSKTSICVRKGMS